MRISLRNRALNSSVLALALTATAQADPLPEHEAQRKQTQQAYDVGNWPQVISSASAILQANPKDNIALHLRGSARIESGIQMMDTAIIREGITDTREAISAATTPDFNYYLPYLYGMTNLTKIEQQPDHARVTVEIAGQLLLQSGITAEQKANVLYQRGLAYSSMKQTADAIQDLKAAVTANPKHIAAYLAIAEIHAEAGQGEQSLLAYADAIRAFPDEPLVYNNQGMQLQKMGRYNEALKAFSTALQKNPQFHLAMTNRGFTWLEGGRPAEAEKDFTASLQMSPQPAVMTLRGNARLLQGRWQEALADYEAVIKASPNDYIAHSDAGFARFFGRDYAGALKEFNEVVRIQPQARFINPWRCLTLIKLGRTAEAAGIAQASRQKTEAQRDWVDYVILFHVGDVTGEELMTRIERTNRDVQTAQLCEARYFIAEQLLSKGQSQQAGTSYQQAVQTGAKQLSAWRGARYALGKFE